MRHMAPKLNHIAKPKLNIKHKYNVIFQHVTPEKKNILNKIITLVTQMTINFYKLVNLKSIKIRETI